MDQDAVLNSLPQRRVRWATIERLRMLAMLEIVGFHCASERTLLFGGFGLSMFLLLTNLFNCTVSNKRGLRQFVKDKFNRLFYPWLFWCAAYAVANAVLAINKGRPLADEFDPFMLLYGTNVHLWFIPFALFSGILVGYLQARTAGLSHSVVIIASAGFGALILLVSAYLLEHYEFRTPAGQYLYALPSPFIGFAMGRSLLIESPERLRRFRIIFCASAAAFGVLAFTLPIALVSVRYAISAILITLALVWPGKSDWLTTTLTPLLLGVYLIHPLLVRVTKRWPLLDDYIVLYAVAIFVLSAVVIWLMRKTALNRCT